MKQVRIALLTTHKYYVALSENMALQNLLMNHHVPWLVAMWRYSPIFRHTHMFSFPYLEHGLVQLDGAGELFP